MNNIAFNIYLFYTTSYFLHFTARFPILAPIRFDLILVGLVFISLLLNRKGQNIGEVNEPDKVLRILIIYIILSLPFVKWPGSVIYYGIPEFAKAVIFYYFSVSLINSEKKLKIFIAVFMICQIFRILEPLYLHLTTGYWGDFTNMEGEKMERLSGSPYDVINPNGLAYVIVSIIPFFHYLSLSASRKFKILYIIAIPVFIYALILTASRSGFLALSIIILVILLKSRMKILLLTIIGISSVVVISNLSQIQKERYLSIERNDVRGAATAHGRIEGVEKTFDIALEAPIFGHGLGTSGEANYNAIGMALRAHNLYVEVWEDLGLVGLIIFLFFLKSIISNFRIMTVIFKNKLHEDNYFTNFKNGMEVWLYMNFLFSFASYGLSLYPWYLFGGFSVVLRRLSETQYQRVLTSKSQFT